ncbi:hypothetical protein ONZ45_g8021 [Pleurotus djamor]|nr:hypothetical protein ONZ45_g8021 [Pleurotus djamor]
MKPANESQLPPWLADTFLSLNQEHPLRALLPDECHFTPDPTPYEAPRIRSNNTFRPVLAGTAEIEPTVIEEETVFAFHPPEPNSNLSMNAMLSRTDARAPRSKSLSHSSIGLAIAPNYSPTEFKPFSKAGPCSMLSVDPLPQPRSLMLPDALSYHSESLAPCSPAAPSRFPSVDHPPYDDINECSVSRDAAPSASAYDLPFDAYSGYIDEYPEDTVTIQADSPIHSSDPPLPSSDTLTNLQHSLYTKPGPGYYASHSVYFDSPAEDPRLSDPLDPEDYTVDWGDLDFRWKPFLRGYSGAIYGEDADKHISVRLSPIPVQHHEGVPTVDVSALQPPPHSNVDKPRPTSAVQSFGEAEEPEESESVAVIGVYTDSYPRFVQRVTTPRTPMNNSQARAEPVDPVRPGDSDSPMTNSPPWETYSQHQQVVNSRSPSVCSRLTPEGESKPVFAPAPGIFISPLQGSDSGNSSPQSTDGSLQFGLNQVASSPPLPTLLPRLI